MKKRPSTKNDPQQKIKKKKLVNKSIALNSDSDSDNNNEIINKKANNPKIIKTNNNNNKPNKLLGNKIKKERDNDTENIYIPNKKEKEDDNMVVFPYEFTERLIDALSCSYCNGIYIHPYVINMSGCEHIFCLGCITKMLENTESGICPKCKNHFTERNIKYSEVTDHYIKIFFPEIENIIKQNKTKLVQFMESEAMKYNENKSKEEKGKQMKCEIKPFRESVPDKNKMREIQDNKFIINISSEQEDVVDIIKSQVIRKLNMRGILKSNDIEIRMQGIEISPFKTFEDLKNLPMNLDEIITFYYSKKDDD